MVVNLKPARTAVLLVLAYLTMGCAATVHNSKPVKLTIYSPAPPSIILHRQNIELGNILRQCGVADDVQVVPMALPESINFINTLPTQERPFHIPIITTLDYQTAVDATAPEWHAYDRANPDLKFVARLYEVVFGVLAFKNSINTADDLIGKRIGVPARPSAVRWLTESLLEHGWGIADEVTLVNLSPPQLATALKDGQIDATTWNIMSETSEGYQPVFPQLLKPAAAHFISVDDKALARMLDKAGFATDTVPVGYKEIAGTTIGQSTTPTLLSFAQGLAAWDATPASLVRDIVSCLDQSRPSFDSSGTFTQRRLQWPGLQQEQVHPGAVR